jgi:WXG100 family type VII secretion target
MTEIQVTYGHMESASAAMREISNVVDGKLDTLRGQLRQIVWQGAAKEEYRQCQDEWDAAVAALNELLNRIGATVNIARQNYLDTEMQIKGRWASGP